MQKNKTSKSNQLRIIGGMYRSRKLTFPTIPGLRPTGDRIRETLFNWLAPHVFGSRCLDLFAGSGALGIEALSRGASHVTFIDNSALACESIRNHLHLLDPELIPSGKARVVCHNSLLWLTEPHQSERSLFDIVFLDPPFTENLGGACAEVLEQSAALTPECLIYVEEALHKATGESFVIPASWLLVKNKQAGNVRYQLFNRK